MTIPSALVPKASTPGMITPAPNDPVADADLTFGAATYSLPIGSLMLQGLDDAGPYQSPMEDAMVHFHEWLRKGLGA